jgi:hypothetical protein
MAPDERADTPDVVLVELSYALLDVEVAIGRAHSALKKARAAHGKAVQLLTDKDWDTDWRAAYESLAASITELLGRFMSDGDPLEDIEIALEDALVASMPPGREGELT